MNCRICKKEIAKVDGWSQGVQVITQNDNYNVCYECAPKGTCRAKIINLVKSKKVLE